MEARVAVMAKLTQHIHPSALFSLSKILDSGFLPTLLVKPVFLPLIQVFVFYIVSCQRQITMLVLHVALGNSLARSPAARMQWRQRTGSGNERPSFYQTESSKRNSAWGFLPTLFYFSSLYHSCEHVTRN